jgi:hypothetical protein
MRSATVTATFWFLIGVAAALSVTSLAIVTIPIAVVLMVVVLRKGPRDRWLWSAALIGAAVVLLYFGFRQWGVPGCSGVNGETGSATVRPGQQAESRCGGLPATPAFVLAALVGASGVGGLASRFVRESSRAPGNDA